MIYGRPWTFAEDQQLKRRWCAGMPIKTVAAELTRSVDVVRGRLRKLGFAYDPATRNQCAWTPETDARLTALWADPSITSKQIGIRLGTTSGAIKTRAATIRLPRRTGFVASQRALKPTPVLDDDEEPVVDYARKHAIACLDAGGFVAFSETWAGRGSVPQSLSMSKDWRLGPLEPAMRRAA